MSITTESMKSTPLTIEFPVKRKGKRTITIRNAFFSHLCYSINGGDRISVNSENHKISVRAGDKVSFYAHIRGGGIFLCTCTSLAY